MPATNLGKIVINKRQCLRRRIEVMKVTLMNFKTNPRAAQHLTEQIAKAEAELAYLETHWEV